MGMKDIREARGLTHRDLADMIGMAQSTVTRAENHAKTSKLATYVKIAAALDVSLSDLFADSKTATELALLSAFRRVPESRQEQWVQILQAAEARDQSESAPSTAAGVRSNAEVPH